MASSDRNREEEEDDVSMDWTKIVGTKFNPTDEILAGYYLTKKAAGRNDGIFKCIKQVEIYKLEPLELQSLAFDFGDGKKRMYFVTALKMKNRKGTNVDRLTRKDEREIGFWKITGNISYVERDGRKIASKTPLAYYEKKTSDKPEKSQWLMTEYRLIEDQSDEESKKLALCVIYFRDTRSGKGVREEKNKQSSVYEKGEGSNSKNIVTEAASSSLPPTENSSHQDTLETPIADSYQNMLGMDVIGSNFPYQNMPYPEMESQGSNFVQNIPNQVMGVPDATAADSNLELPSETIADLEDCPLLPTEDSFEYSLVSMPIPIPYSDQNMLVMGSQGSNYPYQNMPDPVMESQGSNFVQNIPNQVMGVPDATAADSNLELPSETIADLEDCPLLPTKDSFEYSLVSMPIPIPYSDQNMLVMGSQGSNYPYQNMPDPVMESQGSNFVQNIPNQEMGLPDATATDSNLELPSEIIADLEDCPLLPTEDSFEYSLVMGSQGSNFVQNIPNQVMGLHGATATDSNLELQLETFADLDYWLTSADLQDWQLLLTEDSFENQTWKKRRF